MENNIITRAAIYARYSSDLQRQESINAQIRACKFYAQKENIDIVKIYADKAKSGTMVKGREGFLEMIEDSSLGEFDIVLVHKLNRFGRNGFDTLRYKKELEKNHVALVSVTERLDDTPEGKLMLMVISGINEFYSASLSTEVMKGLRENAFSGKHTGGTPPLGYDLDRNTMKLIINDNESEAVRLIYKKYIEGAGYGEIIEMLNSVGFKTKRGTSFSKNSIYEILKQEKYTGVYIYNKTASKNMDGKFNRHKHKESSDIIRLEGMVPQIISKEDFNTVQEKLAARKHKAGQFSAKETYLLTGKILCGECGAHYTGFSRKARVNNPQYVSYNCSKRHGKSVCSNTGVRREHIESYVLEKLASHIFTDDMLPKIVDEYKKYAASVDKRVTVYKENAIARLMVVNKEIDNIVSVIATTGSKALNEKLSTIETEKAELIKVIKSIETEIKGSYISDQKIKATFKKAKKMFAQGALSTNKKLLDNYVEKIVIYKEHIEIQFNLGITTPHDPSGPGDFNITELLVLREQRAQMKRQQKSTSI